MRRRILSLILVLPMLIFIAAGCNGGGTSGATTQTTASQQAATSAATSASAASEGAASEGVASVDDLAQDADKVVLRAVHPGNSEAFFDMYATIIADFENAHPGVEIQFESYPEGYNEKLLTLFASNDSPDIIRTHAGDLGDRIKNGMVVPITKYFTSDEDLIENAVFKVNDEIYFIDPYFAVQVLYYNRDMFDDAGMEYPTDDWDWQDLMDAAERLNIKDGDNFVQYGYYGDYHIRFFLSHYWSNGSSFFDNEFAPSKLTFNNPEALQSIQYIRDITYSSGGVVSTAGGTISAIEAFTNGIVAMMMDGAWMSLVIGEKEDLNFGVALMPKGTAERAGFTVPCGETMSSATKYPDLAWEYIKSTFSKDSSLLFCGFGDITKANGAPVWKSAYTDPRWEPGDRMEMIGKQAQETTKKDMAFPLSSKWEWDVVNSTFQEMYANDYDAQKTLDLIIERTQRDVLDEIIN